MKFFFIKSMEYYKVKIHFKIEIGNIVRNVNTTYKYLIQRYKNDEVLKQ